MLLRLVSQERLASWNGLYPRPRQRPKNFMEIRGRKKGKEKKERGEEEKGRIGGRRRSKIVDSVSRRQEALISRGNGQDPITKKVQR